MQICKEKQDKDWSRSSYKLKAFYFLHSKTFTPTPITLKIKIKESLNTYFVTFQGLWSTKSAGFDWSI